MQFNFFYYSLNFCKFKYDIQKTIFTKEIFTKMIDEEREK